MRRRKRYPLVHKAIRMRADSEILLPSWRRPLPRRWVKVGNVFPYRLKKLMFTLVDQAGVVRVKSQERARIVIVETLKHN